MFWGSFWKHRKTLEAQYRDTNWEEASGQSQEALEEEAVALTQRLTAERLPKPLIKARLFAYALDHAQLAVVPEELFQDHIRHGFVVQKQRATWEQEVNQHALAGVVAACASMYAAGAYQAINDFGHTVPDWYDVLRLGYPGLLARVRLARQTRQVAGTLTAEQTIFYDASILTYEAVLRYLQRMGNLCADKADAFDGEDGERLRYCAAELHALAEHAPQTLHQALQATFLFHILQEEMEGERLRSLGGLDREFAKFQQRETADGTLTDAQTVELWQDFFQKFHALTGDALFGEPMYLGGTLADGSCAVNDTTYTILHAYDSLQIANPKFHIRIASDTPARFLREVLDCIRRGNSSFVFVSDDCAIPMMQRLGVPVEEAREYVPVGCYEPGILGREVACTGNGGVSMPKAVELALNDGMDGLTGQQIGPHTGKPECFATFAMLCDAVKAQLAHLMQCMMRNVCALEVHYMEINPSPLFSATMRECVEAGVDAYAGGAKYNNSSLYLYGNGTMADELAMIKKWVYQRQTLTLPALVGILQNNWEGQELLRMRMKHDPDKWGNNRSLPDEICVLLCAFCADFLRGRPNARGGVFKPALFSIDYNYYYGGRLEASADGRKRGECISRNLGATSTMDRQGVTALIASVTKLDHAAFPTGSVLDIVLHPTAVAGEEGLIAFEQIIRTYFRLGGFAIHGNVLDAKVLRAAQAHPEAYPNLQVRVCGWNVYFVNLSKAEQEEFIARAEA